MLAEGADAHASVGQISRQSIGDDPSATAAGDGVEEDEDLAAVHLLAIVTAMASVRERTFTAWSSAGLPAGRASPSRSWLAKRRRPRRSSCISSGPLRRSTVIRRRKAS